MHDFCIWQKQILCDLSDCASINFFACLTHHINDLLEGEPEGEDDGVRLVDDGALQLVVVGQQVV